MKNCSKPNSETLAAIQEADDIINGRVYAKRYTNLDEMWADMDTEDATDAHVSLDSE